jgi:threonine dehydratase
MPMVETILAARASSPLTIRAGSVRNVPPPAKAFCAPAHSDARNRSRSISTAMVYGQAAAASIAVAVVHYPQRAVTAAPQSIDLPAFADVERAATRLRGIVHRTPVLTSRTADARAGATLFFKCENLQRAGAFKFRGAYNAVAALPPEQRARGVVAFSSGNHAQAMAMACKILQTRSTIVMPKDAPATKAEATRGYGADLVFYDRYSEDREAIAMDLSSRRGLSLVPPFDHADVIAGQGTAAKELFDEVGALDVLVTPMGGGGLLSGSSLSAAALSPRCALFGVEPAAGDDGRQSLQRGEIVTIAPPRSIADGAVNTHIGERPFAILRKHAVSVVTASDAELIAAMRFFAERMKIVVEPTGCLGLAAVFGGAIPCRGKRVGIILSGGNVDVAALAKFLA